MVNSGTTGSYSVTTTLPWKKKSRTNITNSKTKKKNARNIIHQIFEKCSSLSNDNFWVSVYQNCARGKFPRYFYYKNKLITYRKGNKTERVSITNSVSEAFTTSIEFFRDVGGILSESDRIKRQKYEEERMLELSDLNENASWKDIKIDKIKDVLITEFINDIVYEMNFNNDEKNELMTIVKKGFMLKYFGVNDIYMKDNRIEKICGLSYDKKNNKYFIDQNYITNRPGRKVNGLGIDKDKDKSVNFMDNWVKYLKNLEEKRIKKKFTSSSFLSASNDELSISYNSLSSTTY